jgi:glutamyl-Q tRNA(Asp) synthetase
MFASGDSRRSSHDLVAFLDARLDRPLTRFAPAPTGALHLGHVVNAIYVWGLARALNGRVLLRIEDHDRQRARPEHERGLLDDLDWLGFEPDVFPTSCFRAGRCEGRQSDRDAVYRAALAPLVAAGLVYGCDCSRARQQAAQSNTDVTAGERRYPGTCRDRGLALVDGVGWRIRLDEGVECFEDALAGPQAQDPAQQSGDLLLRDRLGNWTYHCVAAIDDTVQGVTLVVRGQDLLHSTARQIRLARLLGRRDPPAFVHHALVMKSAAQKLSKSDRDSGIRDLRAAGWSAEDVIGRAARLAGLGVGPARLALRDLPPLFRGS